MANELAKTEHGMFNMQAAMRGLQRNGLVLPPHMKYDAWRERGQALGVLGQAVPWAIGDWLCYGEHEYGQKYAEAMKITGYSYKTCLNYKYVASRIDISRRRDISIGHHAAVAPYPPDVQDQVLAEAVDQNLTVIQVMTLLRSRGLEVEGNDAIETTATRLQEALPSPSEAPTVSDATIRRNRARIRRLLHGIVPACEALLQALKTQLSDDNAENLQACIVSLSALEAMGNELRELIKG